MIVAHRRKMRHDEDVVLLGDKNTQVKYCFDRVSMIRRESSDNEYIPG